MRPRRGPATDRWIRIAEIGRADDLPPDKVVGLLARAIEDLGVAQALVLIHGQKRGFERYVEAGGAVRFDEDDEPVIWTGAA